MPAPDKPAPSSAIPSIIKLYCVISPISNTNGIPSGITIFRMAAKPMASPILSNESAIT
ncbi:hypothetical protein D3C77_752280 [compost metagenome]